jgi:hypothetical protein
MKEVTLEEAANKANGYNVYAKETKAPIFNEGFIEGAKWQQKKMYSEEELRNAMNWMLTQYLEFHEQPTTGRIDYYIQSLKQQ